MTARYPLGRRVATGETLPTAADMNALLEERDQLAAQLQHRPASALDGHATAAAERLVVHALRQTIPSADLDVAAKAARVILALLVADPTLYRRDDGHVSITWPTDDAVACIVARPVADALVDDLNRMRAQLADRDLDDVEASEREDA